MVFRKKESNREVTVSSILRYMSVGINYQVSNLAKAFNTDTKSIRYYLDKALVMGAVSRRNHPRGKLYTIPPIEREEIVDKVGAPYPRIQLHGDYLDEYLASLKEFQRLCETSRK